MLTINDLVYRLGGRLLFDHAGVFLPGRSRAGFVGRNGAMTTLFRLIGGEIAAESGISLPSRMRLGRVEQEAPGVPTAPSSTSCSRRTLSAPNSAAWAEAAHDPHDIADIWPGSPTSTLIRPGARRGHSGHGLASTRRRSAGLCRNFPAAGGCASRWRHGPVRAA
ncbi:MAG: hypothetical protein U1E25_00070 [Methylocystis sp.]